MAVVVAVVVVVVAVVVVVVVVVVVAVVVVVVVAVVVVVVVAVSFQSKMISRIMVESQLRPNHFELIFKEPLKSFLQKFL